MKDYGSHDAVGLGKLVASGKVHPSELLEVAIQAASESNRSVNAIVREMHAEARLVASSPLPAGPLSGVPFLLKDLNIQYQGACTSNGSRFWSESIAARDSTIMERYRAAGLVAFGFTNTAELGLACETAPAAHGATRNPWDLSRSAGGSSGGAAAAVAAGIVPAAHATDGGGSIRIPASNCGLFGLKPTRARNPYGPDLGEGWNGLSVHHAITRSVRDSAALLDAVHGPAPGDPYASPPFTGRFLDEVDRDPGRLRIAVMTTDHEGGHIDPACVDAVLSAARLCESLGHSVEYARPTIDAASMKRATRIIVAGNVCNALRTRAAVLRRPPSPGEIEPVTRMWAEEGERFTAADLAWAAAAVHRVGRVLGDFLEGFDILLTSTFASPPLPLRTVDMGCGDFEQFYSALRRHSAFTSVHNCAGIPAASLPLFWSDAGLPIGVQVAARSGEDALIVRLAAQLERAQPWFARTARATAAGAK